MLAQYLHVTIFDSLLQLTPSILQLQTTFIFFACETFNTHTQGSALHNNYVNVMMRFLS
ncbi:hypothetical protein [Kordia sp.]|uniref:hypothetical protein n=1 Tax=Kordia sp. TaxID=1965332 RepID=UPI003B5AD138